MALTRLPSELLVLIITHALPEGFESLALTCRRIYMLCAPFIEHHNELRARFRSFGYSKEMGGPARFSIRKATDLIARISVEPIVARYIRHADFRGDADITGDADSSLSDPFELDPDVHIQDTVMRLLANSTYLKQAGLEWQEYYAKMTQDIGRPIYSQHATAFLLTLLPNVETLILPGNWNPLPEPDKVIDAVIHEAKRSSCLNWNASSLARTISFQVPLSPAFPDCSELLWVRPFLSLPRVRSFQGPNFINKNNGSHNGISAFESLYRDNFGETLEVAKLAGFHIEEVGIANFLSHTTRLRSLQYSHLKLDKTKDGDFCKFMRAIAGKVGSHLEELLITVHQGHTFTSSGRLSMRGFQRLQKLEYPLEIAMFNVDTVPPRRTATSPYDLVYRYKSSDDEPFIHDLIPASVSHLSLASNGTEDHAKLLEMMFRHISTKKQSIFPALKEFRLSWPRNSSEAYKQYCSSLLLETAKVGIDMQCRNRRYHPPE